MFGFKNIAVMAALTFGAISTVVAAPLSDETHNLMARCGCSSAAAIVTDVTTAIAPFTEQLKSLQVSECTVENLTPIVANMKVVISTAIVEVNKLVGQPAEVIMASVDGTAQITVAELSQLIATLICDVFGALGFVLNLGGLLSVASIAVLLGTVGEILGCFLCCLLSATASVAVGLSASVLGLIGSVASVIVRLNVSMLVVVLGIKI